jgi:hypothetical protein
MGGTATLEGIAEAKGESSVGNTESEGCKGFDLLESSDEVGAVMEGEEEDPEGF